jgi:hypothetical protein
VLGLGSGLWGHPCRVQAPPPVLGLGSGLWGHPCRVQAPIGDLPRFPRCAPLLSLTCFFGTRSSLGWSFAFFLEALMMAPLMAVCFILPTDIHTAHKGQGSAQITRRSSPLEPNMLALACLLLRLPALKSPETPRLASQFATAARATGCPR